MEFCMSSGFNPLDPRNVFPTSKPPTGPDGKPVKFKTIPEQDGERRKNGKDNTAQTFRRLARRRCGPIGGLHHR